MAGVDKSQVRAPGQGHQRIRDTHVSFTVAERTSRFSRLFIKWSSALIFPPLIQPEKEKKTFLFTFAKENFI